MKKLLSLSLALPLLLTAACGGEDSCAKLTKDVCGDDKDCAAWVEKDALDGSKNTETCDFLTKDGDYKKWVKGAKSSFARSKEK